MIYRSILKVVEEYQYVEAWIEIRNQEKKGIVGGLDWFKSDCKAHKISGAHLG